MSTGGISLILGQLPFRFSGLDTIGLAFYILDIIVFSLVVIGLILRYTLTEATLGRTLRHPTEFLFLPTAQLTFATIVMGCGIYIEPHVGDWCPKAMLVCFWIFTIVATIQAPLMYLALFTLDSHKTNHTTRNITPGFFLPVFPSMLVGTVANAVVKKVGQADGFNVAIAGLAYQGLGIMVSIFVYPIIIRKLMQFGLPEASHRTGLFILAGPPAFTGAAILGMARSAHKFLPPDMFTSIDASELFLIAGLTAAIFLWQLSAFWWTFAFVSVLHAIITDKFSGEHFHFSMSWWATIFPISGFCISTIYIGQTLQSTAIQMFATGMATYLVIVYFIILGFMVEAVMSKRIMWGDHDEDKPMPVLDYPLVAEEKTALSPVPVLQRHERSRHLKQLTEGGISSRRGSNETTVTRVGYEYHQGGFHDVHITHPRKEHLMQGKNRRSVDSWYSTVYR